MPATAKAMLLEGFVGGLWDSLGEDSEIAIAARAAFAVSCAGDVLRHPAERRQVPGGKERKAVRSVEPLYQALVPGLPRRCT